MADRRSNGSADHAVRINHARWARPRTGRSQVCIPTSSTSWLTFARSRRRFGRHPGTSASSACARAKPHSSTIGRSRKPSRRATLIPEENREWASVRSCCVSSTRHRENSTDAGKSTKHSSWSAPDRQNKGRLPFCAFSQNGTTRSGIVLLTGSFGGDIHCAWMVWKFGPANSSQHRADRFLKRICLVVPGCRWMIVTSGLIASVHESKKSRVTPALRASSFIAQQRASQEMVVIPTAAAARSRRPGTVIRPLLRFAAAGQLGVVEGEQLPLFGVPVVARLDGGAATSSHFLRLFRMGQ